MTITTAGSTSSANNFLDQQQNATISGSVLNDLNGDGLANDGGVGVAGATVALFRDVNTNGVFDSGTDTQVGASVTTPVSGAYSFASLATGVYFVNETNPAGFFSTAAIAGSGTGTTSLVQSSDRIRVTITTAGSTSSANNFLDQQRDASISGTVYNDIDGSGDFTVGETGLAGVTVSYSGGTPATSGSVSTGVGGGYTISGLQAGSYSVDYTVPSGYVNTGPRPLTGIVLAAGGSATGQSFFAQAEDPELTLVKSSDDTSYDEVGDVLIYGYLLTNSGNVTLTGPFTISDDIAIDDVLPGHPHRLAPGAAVTCTAHLHRRPGRPRRRLGHQHRHRLSEFGRPGHLQPDNVTIDAVQTPALTFVKSSDDTSYDAVGDVLTYDYLLTNSGNVTLTGPFTITDDIAIDAVCPAIPTAWPPALPSPAQGTYTVDPGRPRRRRSPTPPPAQANSRRPGHLQPRPSHHQRHPDSPD